MFCSEIVAQNINIIDKKGTIHQVEKTDDQDAEEVLLNPQFDIDGDVANE